MSRSRQQDLGNLRLERGDLYAKRTRAARNAKPRQRQQPPDEIFDREVASIYASWNSETKTSESVGGYPSRAIANVAQHLQWPLRNASKHMTSALRAETDIELVASLGEALKRQAYRIRDRLQRQGRKQAGVA